MTVLSVFLVQQFFKIRWKDNLLLHLKRQVQFHSPTYACALASLAYKQ